MGIFDLFRRRKQLPVVAPPAVQPAKNTFPGWAARLRNEFKTPPGSAGGLSNWNLKWLRKKEVPTNVPNKAYNRLNLTSKEARMKEMQKRRASLQSRPKAPFGRR